MPYVLGVHLGATATSAAVARRDGGRWSAATPFPLGASGPTVPTVLCRVQDGSFLAGEAARRQEPTYHEWIARSFVESVGDDVPLMVGGEFVPAERLAATMIEWVADQVAHREGHPAEHIAVAHAAAWGPHRTHVLQQALARLGLTDVTLLAEPVAVGLDFTARQRLADDGTIVVGNVGGSRSDATVLRRRADDSTQGGLAAPGMDVVGTTLDVEYPSGRALDDEVFAFVSDELDGATAHLDPTDPQGRAAAFALRAECTRAREALSYQPRTAVRVELPRLRTQVELSRARFEQLAMPHLDQVPELVQQTVQSAGLTFGGLDAVVLAGGTARTPQLRTLVTERLRALADESSEDSARDALVDGAPELVAARGAAVSAVNALSAATDRAAAVEETSLVMRVEGASRHGRAGSAGAIGGEGLDDAWDEWEVVDADEEAVERSEPPRPKVEVEPMYVEPATTNRWTKVLKLSLAAVLIIFGLVMTFVQGFGGSSGLGILQMVGG